MGARTGAAEVALPPGFRFCPTDSELLSYWLTSKVQGLPLAGNYITDEDILASGPEVIANKLQLEDGISYFFYSCSKKYPNGTRANRATELGYYKATGNDRLVFDGRTKAKLGSMKTLVYYAGRAPSGSKTNWVVHEYKLERANHAEAEGFWVLCKLSQKKSSGTTTPPFYSNVSSPTYFNTTPSPTITPLTRSFTEDFETIGDDFEEEEEEEEEVDYQSIGNDVLAALRDPREDGEAGGAGLGGWLSGYNGFTHMDMLLDDDLAPQVETTEMRTPASTWSEQQELFTARDTALPPQQMRGAFQEASVSPPPHQVLEDPSDITHLLTETTTATAQMEEMFELESDSMGFRGGVSREGFDSALDVFASDSLPVFAEDSKNFLAADEFLRETPATSLHAWTNETARTPDAAPAGQLAPQEDTKPFSWPTLFDNGNGSPAFRFGTSTSQPSLIQLPQEVQASAKDPPMPREGSSGSQGSGGGSLTDSRGYLGLGEGVAERLKMMFERRSRRGGESEVGRRRTQTEVSGKRWRQGSGEREGGVGDGGAGRWRVGSGQQGQGSVAELAAASRGPGGSRKAHEGEEVVLHSFILREDTADLPGFDFGGAREAKRNDAFHHAPVMEPLTPYPLPSSHTSRPPPPSSEAHLRGLTGGDCAEAEPSDDLSIQSSACFWFDASSPPPDASDTGGGLGPLDGLEDSLWGSELWTMTGHGIPRQGREAPPGKRQVEDRFAAVPRQQREGQPMRSHSERGGVTRERPSTNLAPTPVRANGRTPPGNISIEGSCARNRPRGTGVIMSVMATAAVFMMGDQPVLPAQAVDMPSGRSVRLAGRLTEAPAGRFRGVVTMKDGGRCEMCESREGGWGQVADSGWSGSGGREGGVRGGGKEKGERQDGKLRRRGSMLSMGLRWAWYIGAAGLFYGVTHLFMGSASQ